MSSTKGKNGNAIFEFSKDTDEKTALEQIFNLLDSYLPIFFKNSYSENIGNIKIETKKYESIGGTRRRDVIKDRLGRLVKGGRVIRGTYDNGTALNGQPKYLESVLGFVDLFPFDDQDCSYTAVFVIRDTKSLGGNFELERSMSQNIAIDFCIYAIKDFAFYHNIIKSRLPSQ